MSWTAFSARVLVAALPFVGEAAESNEPPVLPPTEEVPAPASPDEVLAANFSVVKAAESLDRVSLHWTQQHKCGSCHATFPYLMSRGVLKEIPSPALTAATERITNQCSGAFAAAIAKEE